MVSLQHSRAATVSGIYASEPPHVVAPDRQVVHRHGRLPLHRELDILHVHVHGHVDTSIVAGGIEKWATEPLQVPLTRD